MGTERKDPSGSASASTDGASEELDDGSNAGESSAPAGSWLENITNQVIAGGVLQVLAAIALGIWGWLDDWFVSEPPETEPQEPDESWLAELDTDVYYAIGAVSLGVIVLYREKISDFFQNLFGTKEPPAVKKNVFDRVVETVSGNDEPEGGFSMTVILAVCAVFLLATLASIYFCFCQKSDDALVDQEPDIEEGFRDRGVS